ncbi:MAG: HAD family hydrolase [Dehalococcoidales bacterium]|nr:HAD family hydrolase [Dehalococcoidales bacterium]
MADIEDIKAKMADLRKKADEELARKTYRKPQYTLTPEQQYVLDQLGPKWKVSSQANKGLLRVSDGVDDIWIETSGEITDILGREIKYNSLKSQTAAVQQPEYKLTPEQEASLKLLGDRWQIASQNIMGRLTVKNGNNTWYILTNGNILNQKEEVVLKYDKQKPPSLVFKMNEKQENTLKMMGGKYKILQQYSDGSLKVEVKGKRYEIAPSGMTYDVEFKEKIKQPKKIKAKESSGGYGASGKLTKRQEEEFAKLGKLARITEYLSGGRVAFEMNNDYYLMSPEGNLSPDVWMQQEQARLKGTGGQLALPPASTYTYVPPKTICQENPERCKPRQIEHVFFDADNTIWDLNGTAANVTGKLKKIDDDTVVELGNGKHEKSLWEYDLAPELKQESETVLGIADELIYGMSTEDKKFLLSAAASQKAKPKPEPEAPENVRNTIKLFPSFRQTLDELDKRGIKSSIISLNSPGTVKRILKEFGLLDRFVEVADSYENKGIVFRKLTHSMGVCPCSSIFLDDYRSNVKDVGDSCGLALQIGKGGDVQEPIEILKFILDK